MGDRIATEDYADATIVAPPAPGAPHPFIQKILDDDDLLALWRLNDTDGVLRDSAGRIPNGTYSNAPVSAAALLAGDATAKSIDFEAGSNQFATPGGVLRLQPNLMTGYTIGFLVRLESYNQAIIFSESSASGDYRGMFLGIQPDGTPRIGGWGGAYVGPNAVPLATDVLLVFTHEIKTTGIANIYKDGVIQGAGGVGKYQNDDGPSSSIMISNWDLGYAGGFGGPYPLDGRLAEMFVSRRVWSPAEIADLQLFRGGLPDSLIWADSFTTDDLSSYSGATAAVAISGGKLVPLHTNPVGDIYPTGVQAANMVIKAQIGWGAGQHYDGIAKKIDANNEVLGIWDTDNQGLKIYKQVGGTYTLIGQQDMGADSDNTVWLVLAIHDATATLYYYNVDPESSGATPVGQKSAAIDASLQGLGSPAVSFSTVTNTTDWIDNFKAWRYGEQPFSLS